MNYPYPTASPYIHAAMSQAVQAFMSGAPLPPNCMFMPMQFPQLLPPAYPQATPYYGPSPYTNPAPAPAPPPTQNYNYPVVPYTKPSKRKTSHNHQIQQPHPDLYNSSSFDSYMENLSWSRLFDHPSRRNPKQSTQNQPSSKKSQSNSSSSSSTTSDETIRRVNVHNQSSTINGNFKQQTKGSLPFKYSSEYIPGINKQQQQQAGQKSQKIKSNDVFIIKKP